VHVHSNYLIRDFQELLLHKGRKTLIKSDIYIFSFKHCSFCVMELGLFTRAGEPEEERKESKGTLRDSGLSLLLALLSTVTPSIPWVGAEQTCSGRHTVAGRLFRCKDPCP
jgi:hypothetical protein